MNTTFLTDESGAVTVDWVVLTAALVGLGLAVMAVVSGGVENLSGDIDTQLEVDHIQIAFAETFGAFDFGTYERMDPVHHAGNWTHLMGQIGSYSETQLDTLMTQGLEHAANGATPEIQAWGVDTYAAGYAQMQAAGEDVSGMTHPQELIDAWQAAHG